MYLRGVLKSSFARQCEYGTRVNLSFIASPEAFTNGARCLPEYGVVGGR